MPLIRSVSIALRNVLSRFYPLFSCCASCGEIKVPLGSRLCTSLRPLYDIDAVFLSARPDMVRQARGSAPWPGKLFFVRAQDEPAPDNLPAGFFSVSEAELGTGKDDSRIPPEALLHTLPLLSDNFLVVPAGLPPEGLPHPLDFFTPNGIPLIPSLLLREDIAEMLARENPLAALQAARPAPAPAGLARAEGDPRAYPHTKDNSRAFLEFLQEPPASPGNAADGASGNASGSPIPADSYRELLPQWLFLSGRGIPVPGAYS